VPVVWDLIRDFNNYPAYIDGVTESVIEDNKGGDEIGAVRRFCYLGNWVRQRLAGHSDEGHTLTYAGIEPLPFPSGLVHDAPASGRRGQQDIHRMGCNARHRAAGCRALAGAIPVLDTGLDSFARKGVKPPSRVRRWSSLLRALQNLSLAMQPPDSAFAPQ
jgi:Polyketide cyclase / dehydrase and lipid transport